jgi:hypothetical protein
MTNEEILGAQKLIADMRNVLAALAGTSDVDKLISLGREGFSPWIKSLNQLIWTGAVSNDDVMPLRLDAVWACAQLAEQSPKYRQNMVFAVNRNVPLVAAALDKIAQSLAETKTALPLE